MKKSLLASTLLSVILSTSACASQLVVWEDIDKGHGITKAIEEFEEDTGCKVVLEQMPYVQHIPTMLENKENGGSIPDVLMLPGDRLGDAALKGNIIPLDFMEAEQNRYIPSAISTFTFNNKIYAMPRSVETMVVYYNQDLLKYPFENFQDYVDFSKQMLKEGRYGVIGKLDVFYYSFGFLGGFGAYVFKDKGNGILDPDDLGLDKPEAIAGLEYVKQLIDTIIPISLIGDSGWSEVNNLFISGKAAAVISGPWELDNYAKAGINYGVAPLGKLPNGKNFTPFLGYRGYAISSLSKNKELAAKFLTYLNKRDNAVDRYSQIHEIPPLTEIMGLPIIQNDDFANAVLTQAVTAYPMPAIPQMSEVWGPIDKVFGEVALSQISPKDGLKRAAKEIRESISQE